MIMIFHSQRGIGMDIVCGIVLCVLAVWGAIDLFKTALDCICEKNISGSYTVLVDNQHEADIEYTIRYIESAVIGRKTGIINGITLTAHIPDDLRNRLCEEYKNIK